MSHFVVMVTNTDSETLEEQLRPFYEQGNEDDYFMEKEYFLERNEKSVEDWLNNEIEDVSNTLANLTIKKIAKKIWRKKLKELENMKELKTLRGKVNAIHEYSGGGIDKKGLYWLNNPDAKWDWWVEGGRWNGWLITNDWEECNRCKVKDLSLDNMRINEMMNRAKWYVKETEVAKREHKKPFFWDYKKKPTIKRYIKEANQPVAPFAILHDGNWMEKGKMGWLGISDDKYTDDNWSKFFKDFIEKLDPETEIAIVDCHI